MNCTHLLLRVESPNQALQRTLVPCAAELIVGGYISDIQSHNETSEEVAVQLQGVIISDYNQKRADAYSRIRLSLRQKGRSSGKADMMIAAIALAGNAI